MIPGSIIRRMRITHLLQKDAHKAEGLEANQRLFVLAQPLCTILHAAYQGCRARQLANQASQQNKKHSMLTLGLHGK